ncbi:MAG: hypothetical protein V4654_08270 [Bdellovibrionota bacterium]
MILKNFVSFIFLFFCTSACLAGFPIKNISLSNPVVSAGEALDISYEVEDGFQVEENGGVNVYLGFIPHNVFIQGEPLNRTSVMIAKNHYRIIDLVVNQWVLPQHESYRLLQIIFYEKETFRQVTLSAMGNDFYMDGEGNPTDIPVIYFKVNPNLNSDVTPPKITEIYVSKSEIAIDETFDVTFSIHDDNSGVSPRVLAAVMLPHQNIINLNPIALGDGRYIFKNLRIEFPERLPESGVFPVGLSIPDHGANYGALWTQSADDQFYLDGVGSLTDIPVVQLKIKK